MKKYIMLSAVSIILIVGGITSYFRIISYLHNQRAREESRQLELIFNNVEVDSKLPSVLIIGDSISIAYTLPVRRRLEGIANVMRPPENCASTLMILENLDRWLGQTRWTVIHFNAGLHDLEHVQSENVAPGRHIMVPIKKGPQWVAVESYRSNLEKIVERLKKTGATLIFATTTPVPAGEWSRASEDVARYNEAALDVMHENGVLIDDLNSVAVESAYRFQKPGDVHFSEAGSEILADSVAASIQAALSEKP